jgi:tetraacyldisaccharide 4'-kinase
VGNLTTGGTGKTPLTMHLAQTIQALGYQPVILSRGYKGRYKSPALVVGDGRRVLADAHLAGDEPIMMAALLGNIPVVVGRDRYSAAQLAIERFNPDLLLLDDGFQHLRLHRSLDLLLLDAERPFGNSHLLPRGTLREPAKAVLRADAVILTRSQGPPAYYEQLCRTVRPRHIFLAEHAPLVRGILPAATPCDGAFQGLQRALDPERWRSKKVLAFSGLARNDLFLRSIRKLEFNLLDALEFDDHHAYRPLDMNRIVSAAARAGAETLITTDKDFVRIPKGSVLPLPMIIMGVSMIFTGGTIDWGEYIESCLLRMVKKSNGTV